MLLAPKALDQVAVGIQPDILEEKGFPRPKRIILTDGMNGQGEPSYFVYLVFPDSTPDEELLWDKIEPMVTWVRAYVLDATGEAAWPYVRVKREAGLPFELADG